MNSILKKTIKITWRFWVSYLGTNYYGWQFQKKEQSVENKIRKAFLYLGVLRRTTIIVASRTDKGVHAKSQVFSCSFVTNLNEYNILLALNHFLPNDILIYRADILFDKFNAKKYSIGKHYLYKVNSIILKNPFVKNYCYTYSFFLKIKKIKKAIKFLLGKKDFCSFRSSKCSSKNAIRCIWDINIRVKYNIVYISVKGNAFCYNMVRILIGTLISVSNGKITINKIKKLFTVKKRNNVGITVPAQGLILINLYYPDNLYEANIPNNIFFPKYPINIKKWPFFV